MGGHLLLGEDGFKLADEVGGGNDGLADGAEEFDGAGVNHRNVHDGIVGRVLHGDAGGVGEDGLEIAFEFLPAGIDVLDAGEGVEATGFDAMDELAGFAGGGDEVVPAAGDVGVGVEAEDAVGDGVAVVMVVEEPAVEVGVAQSGLDGFEVHGDRIQGRGT